MGAVLSRLCTVVMQARKSTEKGVMYISCEATLRMSYIFWCYSDCPSSDLLLLVDSRKIGSDDGVIRSWIRGTDRPAIVQYALLKMPVLLFSSPLFR